MTTTRLFTTAAALLALCACFPDHGLEVRTVSLDHLTAAQAMALATPYLSKDGRVFSSPELLNSITVRDHSRNIQRIQGLLDSRDASPSNVALHFQLIRATEAGEVGPGLENLADALGELLRFKGYQLMSEAVVSASERGKVEQALDGGGSPLQLGVHVTNIKGYERDGSVELEVELRRPSGQLLSTNVVVPIGQTVVLGSAYPGNNGSALILTVRGEMGSQELRTASRRRHMEVEMAVPAVHEHDAELAADVAVRAQGGQTIIVAPSARSRKDVRVAPPRAVIVPTPARTTPPPSR